jgi:hypothetical protein
VKSDSGWEKWRSCLGFEGGEEERKEARKKEREKMMSCHASRPLSLSLSFSLHLMYYVSIPQLYIGVCVFGALARLDYGEEVHKSRILGECSNMIGYEMGSSPAGV